jgi:hypothetical protein
MNTQGGRNYCGLPSVVVVMTPGYEASKISERKWGVFFRLDERTSFGPKAVHATKREARRDAAERNKYERILAADPYPNQPE